MKLASNVTVLWRVSEANAKKTDIYLRYVSALAQALAWSQYGLVLQVAIRRFWGGGHWVPYYNVPPLLVA